MAEIGETKIVLHNGRVMVQPEPTRLCAIPAALLDLNVEKMTQWPTIPMRGMVTVDGFEVAAYIFPTDPGHGSPLYKAFEILEFSPKDPALGLDCQYGTSIIRYFCRKKSDVRVDFGTDELIKNVRRKKWEASAAEYVRVLREFASLLGFRIFLHVDNAYSVQPSKFEAGVLHIFSNTLPPGAIGTRDIATVFTLPISKTGGLINTMTAAQGRGTIMRDETPQDVVQIINNSFYILFPILSYFQRVLSLEIFDRVFRLGWKGYLAEQQKAAAPMTDMGAFVAQAGRWPEVNINGLREHISKNEVSIGVSMQNMASYVRENIRHTAHLKVLESRIVQQREEANLAAQYERIIAEPLVAKVTMDADGFVVRTKRAIAVYNGMRYDLGTFAIRFNEIGHVVLWCEESTHPKNLAHPHIMRTHGNPCYGNITAEIFRAAGELRYYDALTLILRWLVHGYTPELANIKIEEWPCLGPADGDLSQLSVPEFPEAGRLRGKRRKSKAVLPRLNFSQQEKIFNPISAIPVTVIGAGMTGSHTVLGLASIGFTEITVYDGDSIESHNPNMSVYRLCDNGRLKVDALAEIVEEKTGVRIKKIPRHYAGDLLSTVVVCCVDTMPARQMIWSRIEKSVLVPLYIDTRVARELLVMFTIKPQDPDDRAFYAEHLPDEGLPQMCGEHGIYFVGQFTSVAVQAHLTHWLKSGNVLRRHATVLIGTLSFVGN